jgi:endogenous inhibitor of DNA gyrase (YacG/DUF329 family)
MTEVKCARCKEPFKARTADVNRGWGKFCSKSCKAKKQGRLLASKETQKMWHDYNREAPRDRGIAYDDHGVGFHDGHGQE